jgi:hypothetical protein
MNSEWQIARGWHLKGRAERPAYVSLNKRGEIAMNDRAFAAIMRPASVTLLYYSQENIIGVKFPVTADRHFYMARRYGRDRKMHIVRAARALKQFGISVEQTLKFYNPPLVTYRNEPMLLLELGKIKSEI